MSRSKLFALARSITLLASVGAPCLAQAADLLPPPPPPPPVPAPVEVGGGWYLRGDVGVGATDYGKVALRPASVAPDGYEITNRDITAQAIVDGGIGHDFGMARVELTGAYRGGSRLSYVEQFPGQFISTGFDPIYDRSGRVSGYAPYPIYTPGKGLDYDSAHLSSIVVMASGLVTFFTFCDTSLYGGGGVGVALNTIKGWTDIGAGTAAGGFGTAKDKTTTSFAWSARLGVEHRLTDRVFFDVGYTFTNLGHASTGKVNCFNDGCSDSGSYSYKFKDITSHDVKIGLRYLLGGGTAIPLPPLAPAYEPPPGPIVRKY